MLRFLLSPLVVVMIAFPNALAAAEKTPIDFYTAMSVGPQTDLVNLIEKKFPDVKVRWVRSGGVGMYQRFVTERSAGKGKIDILHFSYVPGWYDVLKRNILVEGAADMGEGKKYPSWAKEPKGRWIAHRVPTLWLVINTDNVKPADEPKSWWDLTKPEWKNRIASVDPFNSAGVWDTFWAADEVFGKKYITGILKNNPLIARGMTGATNAVRRGERDVAFVFAYKALPPKKNPKLKLLLMKEGVPVSAAPIALIKDGSHGKAAKKVFEFMLSKEGQMVMTKKVFTSSAHPDVAPPEGLKHLSEYKLIKPNYQKVFDEQDEYRAFMTEHLRKR
jgi:iron(III) transport system substrate-binding protein